MKKIWGVIIGLVVLVSHSKNTNNQKTTTASSTPATNSSSNNKNSSSGSNNSQPTSANAVTISGFAFSPATMTVKKGTTVIWTNQDSASHSVIADSSDSAGGPSSSLIAQGGTYSFTFNTVGTYAYHCGVHPDMKATVTVTE
jgi:plastocyanin